MTRQMNQFDEDLDMGGVVMQSGPVVPGSLAVWNQNGILVRLAALDGTAGTTTYSSKTVSILGTSSTPSATGLAAKAVLQARSCTVNTN